MFKKYLKEYFSFSKSEKYGVFFLIGLIIILIGFQIIVPHIKKQSITDYNSFAQEIEDFKNNLILSSKNNKNNKTEVLVHKLFFFDPNTTSRKEWQMLGLNKKQINTINKYLSKGGRFYRKEDLKKIYGIENKLYQNLEPYIHIKKTGTNYSKERVNNKKKYNPTYDQIKQIKINSIDSDALIRVPGIGEVLSKRIIKYRKSLGGFISSTQIKEVYGISDSVYHTLLKLIEIDTSKITMININSCDLKKLKSHPYINSYQAGAIINYRGFKSGFSSVEEIIQNKLLPKETFNKVKGYLYIN